MKKRKVYLYVMDILKELNIDSEVFFEASEDPLKLFNIVKRDIEKVTGKISGVKVYKTFLDPKKLNGLVEYIVDSNVGAISVKIIYSDKPVRTLIKYYRFERKT